MIDRVCEPSVNWRHPDGAMLTCSNGTLYRLRLTEAWRLKSGRTTIERLDALHREDYLRRPPAPVPFGRNQKVK